MFASGISATVLLGIFTGLASGNSSNSSELQRQQVPKNEEATKLFETINEALSMYDRKMRPNMGGSPVQVTVEVKVVSFGNLKESNMEFGLDIFFRQWWVDPRLQHSSDTPFNIATDPTDVLWTPDTYFVNVKNSHYHHVTRENMRLKINKDGQVYFSTRITLKAQCDMDFRLFPMDTQNCSLVIESYAYTTQEVDYGWRKTKQNRGKGIEIVSDEMAQFEMKGVHTSTKAATNSKGSFASLKVTFTFKRRMAFFMSSVVGPGIILVLLSWCCFWIKREAVPARIALGITTILSAILLSSNLNRQMPKVSYMKAMDLFMLTNLAFIVLAFFEYILVLNTKAQPDWLPPLLASLERKRQGTDEQGSHSTNRLRETEPAMNPRLVPEDAAPKPKRVVVTDEGVYPRVTIIRRTEERPHPQGRGPDKKIVPKAKEVPAPPATNAHWVDSSAKAIFPCSYIVFLMWFWYKYRENMM